MAVQLRCPECKHIVRLPIDPEPDSEMECPECEHTFPCDENIVPSSAGDDDDAPKKKKKKATDGEPAKKAAGEKNDKPAEKPAAAGGQPQKRKKKKSKKRKTPPGVIAGIIVGALMFVGTVGGVMIWFFTKKSASQEMMTYLPDDCDEVMGVNLGHMQKYPDFYKSCEATFANAGFKKAGDAFAKAAGQEFNDAFDYVVIGTGAAGGKAGGQPVEATVLRTKTEFDQSVVSKIPGAREGSANNVKYYEIPEIPELAYPRLRVFAPTNRLVVFCRGDMPDAKFKAMVAANADNLDATPFVRAGVLGKQAIRGTVWKFTLYGRSIARPGQPTPPKSGGGLAGGAPPMAPPGGGATTPPGGSTMTPPAGGSPTSPPMGGAMPGAAPAGGAASQSTPELSDEDLLKKEIADLAAPMQGSAWKASVGSREVRGEWLLWAKESSAASELVKKWKDKDWVKDDEKDPPKWWKALAQKTGGAKTAPTILKDNLSFRSSGELFIIRTAMETKLIQQGVSSLVSAFGGSTGGSSPMGGGMPGGMPGGAQPGGGPGPAMPKPRRRRFPTRRLQFRG